MSDKTKCPECGGNAYFLPPEYECPTCNGTGFAPTSTEPNDNQLSTSVDIHTPNVNKVDPTPESIERFFRQAGLYREDSAAVDVLIGRIEALIREAHDAGVLEAHSSKDFQRVMEQAKSEGRREGWIEAFDWLKLHRGQTDVNELIEVGIEHMEAVIKQALTTSEDV